MQDPKRPPAPDIQEMQAVIGSVERDFSLLVQQVAPWFYDNMPEYYFRTHSRKEREQHLSALVGGRAVREGHGVELQGAEGVKLTSITPVREPDGVTAALLGVLAKYQGREIQTARLYVSKDATLRLDTFTFGPPACARGNSEQNETLQRSVREQLQADLDDPARIEPDEAEAFRAFLASAPRDCVEQYDPAKVVRHFRQYRRLDGGDSVLATLERKTSSGESRVSLALRLPLTGVTGAGQAWGSAVLFMAAKVLHRHGLSIQRAYADTYLVDGPGREPLFILSFYTDPEPLADRSAWDALKAELGLTKWFAAHELEAYWWEPGWSLKRVALLQAATEFAHQFLLYVDRYAYTASNVVATVLRHKNVATAFTRAFEARFDAAATDEARSGVRQDLAAAVQNLGDEVERRVFAAMECLLDHTLRSNYTRPAPFGLVFRLAPEFLAALPQPRDEPILNGETPYGIYFFHGPHYLGFHVRYREMSRGGVRVVPARKQETFEVESTRLFHEVTALAASQQSKNKDIPEGGAKAVLLVGPGGSVDLAVKSMVDSLLDVIPGPGGSQKSSEAPAGVDYLGQDEIIYLGPDENILPAHIEWIVQRARSRRYAFPSALMSSKPRTGINHKQYGVTSLGVLVFAEEVLKLAGMDPHRQDFRVKISGGPRGDVAGNAMRLLARDHGERARIVAVSDGHGAAYDPDGLDQTELLRLVDGSLGIREFSPAKLRGSGAQVAGADTPDGAKLRDTLHFTAQAELFIPAGGRPDTINMRNWRQYFLPDGAPSAGCIVEGANLFIAPDARAALENAGVLVVQGPSANKCGVICSSYEVLAGLVLSDEEFLAVKDDYVAQVLDILRKRAGDEARRLVAEYRAAGGRSTITAISRRLSREINTMADAIYDGLCSHMESVGQDEVLRNLVLDYCPPLLGQRYADRLVEPGAAVPLRYLLAMTAHHAAAGIVYAEGVGWLNGMSTVTDAQAVMRAYHGQARRLDELLELVDGCKAPADLADVADVLRATGRKHLTAKALGMDAG